MYLTLILHSGMFDRLSIEQVSTIELHLEALPVDDGGAALIVLLLGDPHLLEGGEGSQDGSSDPDGVLPLRGIDDLDLDGGRSQGSDLLLHTVSNTGVHGGASGHDGVGVQVLPDVSIALHDGVEGGLVDAAGLHSQEAGLEESLRAPEPLVSDGDDLSVGQLVGLLQGGGGSSSGHFLLKIQGNVAELLLDVPDNFPLSSGGECVSTLSEDLHEISSEFTTSKIKSEDSMRKSITFIDRDGMRDSVTGVHDDTSGTTGGVQRQHSLDGDVHGGRVECLEHDLCHLLSVSFGIERSLSKKDWLFLRSHTQLIEECVMPDLLHVVPVGDNSMLYWILESEDASLGLSLISDIRVLLSHTHHHPNVSPC